MPLRPGLRVLGAMWLPVGAIAASSFWVTGSGLEHAGSWPASLGTQTVPTGLRIDWGEGVGMTGKMLEDHIPAHEN